MALEPPNITVKVFSDLEDISSIKSALSKLKIMNYELEPHGNIITGVEEGNIIISLIETIESPIIAGLVLHRNEQNIKFLFVVISNDALLVATLAKLGFNDIFVFPYEVYKFVSLLDEIIEELEGRLKGKSIFKEESGGNEFSHFIGESESIQKIKMLAQKVALEPKLNILILGETGTGKGLLAKLIHENSLSNDTAFVDVLCTAIPESLLESELFGHEKGAFTNAHTKKPGLFELAENGTLFLDEIGDLSLNLQAKLLRVIEKKVIRRLGGISDIPINARIISATNRKLKEMIEENSFRNDLFYRLNTVSIELPPLRERSNDIMLLLEFFIEEYNIQFNKNITKVDDELKNFILGYSWPGNVRELKNSVERAVLLSEGKSLKLRNFSSIINFNPPTEENIESKFSAHPHIIQLQLNYISTNLEKLNHIYAEEILRKFNGNKTKTSQQLGISRPRLDKLLKNTSK